MNKKTTKKTTYKPEFIVDITSCKDAYDVALQFAITKQKNGKVLSEDDLILIIDASIETFLNEMHRAGIIKKEGHDIYSCEPQCAFVFNKKPNVFKRFWNWLIGKKA